MMKEENVLNVLMYLFQNHLRDSYTLYTDSERLFEHLEEAGFESKVINQAMDWLETLIDSNMKLIQAPRSLSTRVFSTYEKEFLGRDCQRFIIGLELQNILTPETREIVINQLLGLGSEVIDTNLIKWVTLMVLFNQSGNENALACMEFLVLDNPAGGVH